MKKRFFLLAVVAIFFVSNSSAWAADKIVETVAKRCYPWRRPYSGLPLCPLRQIDGSV
jgi:hypothetical protein